MGAVSSFKTWALATWLPTHEQFLITSMAMTFLLVLVVAGLEWNTLRRAKMLNDLEWAITTDRKWLELLNGRLAEEEKAITTAVALMEEIHGFLIIMQKKDAIVQRVETERAQLPLPARPPARKPLHPIRRKP